MRPLSVSVVLALVVTACTTATVPTTTGGTTVPTSETIATTTTIAPWVPPTHPIQIVNGGFVDTRTGRRFVPRGANYLTRVLVGGGYQNRALSPAVFDPNQVAADLTMLADHGYNTIRVFLDSCSSGPDCIGNPEGPGLNQAYLDTIVEFMELAKQHEIFLLFTSNDLPDEGGYWSISDEDNIEGIFPGYRNSHYLTESGERAATRYWNDLLDGLIDRRAPFDIVLAWSALNEQWMFKNQPPLSLTSGVVTTKTGSYDMADSEAKRLMVEDGVRSYLAAVAEIVRRHDPEGLFTSGFFAPQFPNPTAIGGEWYVDTAPLVEDSSLDFFDFHAYPGEDISLAQIVENFGLPGDKPVIMGEYGAFLDRFPDIENAALNLQDWVAATCDLGFDGWIYWEFAPADVSVGDATWALTADDNYLLDVLSPSVQPDPCVPPLTDRNLASRATVSASAWLDAEPPILAIDGDPTTQWGAGAGPTQWIEIDLGGSMDIGEINLIVAQFPSGLTRHLIDIDGERVWAFENDTRDGDILTYRPTQSVTGRVIRITTISSPSWVAWKEVEVFGPSS